MKKKIFTLILTTLTIISLTSCNKTLSENELDIINKDIPEKIYEQMVKEQANALDDYLFDCIEEYSDVVNKEVDSYIEETTRFNSVWHSWDMSALLGGPTPEERAANQYNNYIKYINRNRQNMYDIIMGIAGKIAENPTILNNIPGNSENVNLDMFSDIEYVPNSISRKTYDKYINKTFNKSDKLDWGKTILPYSEKPKLSIPALVVAVISAINELPYPKPVYAVYDKQCEAWEVGYSTNQAVDVVFTKNGDVINWVFQQCDYKSSYIQSNVNVLKVK